MKPPLSLEALADWCDKQGDHHYTWSYPEVCACGLYADEIGFGWREFKSVLWQYCEYGGASSFWVRANAIAEEYPHTFSALAKRLREAHAEA